ncbi:MAG: sigma-70 family RNA polymerase sigma factor [Planctomycetota bacterium]
MEPEELLTHSRFLTALARSLVSDEHIAADLTQDTWVAALEHPPSSNDNLRAWLSKATRNFLRMRQRGESRRRRREYAYAPDEGIPSTEEIVAQEELRQKVVEAVLSLDEPYRSTIVLRYYKDLPHKEVARRLGMSIDAMRGVLKKGIAQLRARLDKSHGGNRRRWLAVMVPIAGLAAPKAVAGSSSVLAGVAVMSAKLKLGIASVFVIGVSLITFMMIQLGSMDAEPVDLDLQIVENQPKDQEESRPLQDDEAEKNREPLPAEQKSEPGYIADKSKSFTIAGRTLNREGLPLGDVQIFLKSSPDDPLALSDQDGCFAPELSLGREAKRRHETIILHKSGYLTRQFECVLDPAEKTIHLGDIVLEQGATLSGSVLDTNRGAVAGAQVGFSVYKALGAAMEGILRRLGQGVKQVQQTDAAGLFRLEEVPEGWICVWACSGDSLYTPSKPVEVHAGDVIEGIEITLEGLAKDDFIAGQVFDPDGLPMPGADIEVFLVENGGFDLSYTEEADDEGRFMTRLYKKVPHSIEARDPEGKYDMAHVENVEPGTHDLVLKLKRFREEVELHVSTSGLRSLETYEVRICSSLTGRMISMKRFDAEPLASGSGVRLLVPHSPFYLSISADGFDKADSKVYYPEALPERIDMLLQSLPGVRGRVLAGGAPVKGVEVGLYRQMEGELLVCDFLCRSLLQAVVKTVSDSRGCFDLGLNASGVYYLRCECEGFPPMEVGPLELDKDMGKEGLEIKLLRGGVIQGEVLMPPGRDRAGIVVAISRGDGQPLSYRTGPDGRFLFEGITPGPWQVERREQMIMPETRFTSFSGTRSRPPVEWDCWVEEGKRTNFDLYLTGWTDCRLEGVLTLDGSAPKGWTCELKDDLAKARISQGDLRFDGSFSQQVATPGEYHLQLAGCIEDKSLIVVYDRVILIPGETSWSHDLSLGSLELKGRLIAGRIFFKWMGPGNLHAYVSLPLSAEERTVNVSVPMGHGSIVHRGDSGTAEIVLCEVEVKGTKTRVDLGTIYH